MPRGSRHLLIAVVVGAWGAAPLSGALPQVQDVQLTVDGRAVRALCTGGPRKAILLHGDGGSAESWRPVLERLSGAVGACAYDRPHKSERGWFELLEELRTVHAALGVEPGYVLVGHAVGGLYGRLFASDRPLDLGGLVLLDPVHEDMPDEARMGMPEAAWSAWVARRLDPNADGVREADLSRRARGTRLPDIPVTVITATERESGPGWDERFLAEAARRVHASILRGVRLARHVPAEGSGHQVHLEAPGLVAAEISRMAHMTSGEGR